VAGAPLREDRRWNVLSLTEAARAVREQLTQERRDAEADWATAQYVPERTP